MFASIAELEAQLRRAPDDAEAWAVYGDALLEQGDPRGELIQLAARPPSADVLARIDVILAGHEWVWRAAVPVGVEVLEWRHGFVLRARIERVDSSLEDLLAADAARLLGVLELRAGGFVEIQGIASLDVSRLVTLDCAYASIGEYGARAIALAPLDGLRTLDLRYASLGDEGFAEIARAKTLRGLEVLHLQRNDAGAAGAEALANGELAALTALDLRYNALGAAGVAALLEAPFVSRLARLTLYRDDVGPDGARALAACEALAPKIRNRWRTA